MKSEIPELRPIPCSLPNAKNQGVIGDYGSHSIQEKIMLPFVSDLVLALIEINFENIHESAVHHYAGTKSAMLELQTL